MKALEQLRETIKDIGEEIGKRKKLFIPVFGIPLVGIAVIESLNLDYRSFADHTSIPALQIRTRFGVGIDEDILQGGISVTRESRFTLSWRIL